MKSRRVAADSLKSFSCAQLAATAILGEPNVWSAIECVAAKLMEPHIGFWHFADVNDRRLRRASQEMQPEQGAGGSGLLVSEKLRTLRRSPLNDPMQFTSLVVRQAPCSGEKLRLREPGPSVVFAR